MQVKDGAVTMTLKKIQETANFLKQIYQDVPKVVIVLGSGLGDFASCVESPLVIRYNAIPHFLPTSVPGHSGKLILGKIQGISVAILQGRLHAYEGHSLEQVIHPIRSLGYYGIHHAILTNAAGGIANNFNPGDLAIIDDHINLTGLNALTGTNFEELGPRFPDMGKAYNPEWRKVLRESAQELKFTIKNGIYAQMSGPSYETPAEIRMLRTLGASMVGMSTVPEVVAAHHMGMKVAAISCISNYAAGIREEPLRHEEIKIAANKAMKELLPLITLSLHKMRDLYSW